MKNAKVALLLFGSQFFYLLFLPVWFTFYGVSLMNIEQDGSFAGRMVLYAVGSYPVVLMVAIVISWMSYHRYNWKKMLLVNSLPIIWIAPILFTFIFATIFNG
ncbi:hypothetical protein KP77_30830 [Jeotgalibacillus alimentarius]|uniref:Uncharacterized protein n=1 Tax=Jeotgalibacillus alimentarius TaxID=135826 RepID=A0A0C2V2V0_9BACL|nr:hypothetical protein [Jeotgalibacillus alimentarius]KIL43377.1 hypothetical protein KP77_30830 [Jeotgalibacillus alimentarius]